MEDQSEKIMKAIKKISNLDAEEFLNRFVTIRGKSEDLVITHLHSECGERLNLDNSIETGFFTSAHYEYRDGSGAVNIGYLTEFSKYPLRDWAIRERFSTKGLLFDLNKGHWVKTE